MKKIIAPKKIYASTPVEPVWSAASSKKFLRITNILPDFTDIYSHPISMSDLTFDLFDLEDAVERSVAVCLSVPPPVGLNSLRSRSGCYVDFAASDTPSFFEERPKLKEQSESSTEEDQLLFHSSEADRGVGLCSLPALYVLDHTHLRLRTADSLALSSVDHPLDAVVRAQSLLPQQFSSINCDCQVVRSKSKMKGILFSGREHVDFRIHCFRDGADTILEFHRRSGSSYLWNLYFKEISRLLDPKGASQSKYLQTSSPLKLNISTFDHSISTNSSIDPHSIERAMQMSISEGACALAAGLNFSLPLCSHYQRSDHSELLQHLKELVKELAVDDVLRSHHAARAVAALCQNITLDDGSAELIIYESLQLLQVFQMLQQRSERRALPYDKVGTQRYILSALECCSIYHGKQMSDAGAVQVLTNLRFAAEDVDSAAMTGRCLKNIRLAGTKTAASNRNFY